MTPEEIEGLYSLSFKGPFPYRDCYWLAETVKRPDSELIPELDSYFADIAGYASSASRLHNRTPEELQRARRILSRDLYERFPDPHVFRSYISEESTPELYRTIELAGRMRLALLGLLGEISGSE